MVSISARHAEDPGAIPGRGVCMHNSVNVPTRILTPDTSLIRGRIGLSEWAPPGKRAPLNAAHLWSGCSHMWASLRGSKGRAGGEHREGLWVCGSMGLGGARRRNDGPASRRVVALLFVCVKKQVHKSAPLLTKLTWPQGALRQDPLRTTPVGFEPTRGDPTGLAGRRLSRSAKVSVAVSFC